MIGRTHHALIRFAAALALGGVERRDSRHPAPRAVVDIEMITQRELLPLSGRQHAMEIGARCRQLLGAWRKLDGRSARDVIQTPIAQHHPIGGNLIRQPPSARAALHSAHFEDVGEISIVLQGKRQLDWDQAVVGELESFKAGRLPQKLGAKDMQIAAAQRNSPVYVKIRIGQVDRK